MVLAVPSPRKFGATRRQAELAKETQKKMNLPQIIADKIHR
jgi:hypothetical protein